MQNRPVNSRKYKYISKALWAGPIGNAIYSTGYYAINLSQVKLDLSLLIFSTPVAALTSLGLSKKFTLDGIDEIDQFTSRSFELPDGWPRISRQQEMLALTGGVVVSILYGGINGVQSYYYMNQSIPTYFNLTDTLEPHSAYWKAGSGIISGLVVLNTILGKGISSYKTLRHLLSDEHYAYANRCSRILSPLIGSTIGSINAGTYMLSNFQSVVQDLDAANSPLAFVIGSGALLSIFGDLSSNNLFLIESINQIIAHLAANRPSKSEMTALMLALSASSLFSYGLWLTYAATFDSVLKTLDLDQYEQLNVAAPTLTGLYAATCVPVNTASLYPIVYAAVNNVTTAASRLFNWVTGRQTQESLATQKLSLLVGDDTDLESGVPAVFHQPARVTNCCFGLFARFSRRDGLSKPDLTTTPSSRGLSAGSS